MLLLLLPASNSFGISPSRSICRVFIVITHRKCFCVNFRQRREKKHNQICCQLLLLFLLLLLSLFLLFLLLLLLLFLLLLLLLLFFYEPKAAAATRLLRVPNFISGNFSFCFACILFSISLSLFLTLFTVSSRCPISRIASHKSALICCCVMCICLSHANLLFGSKCSRLCVIRS